MNDLSKTSLGELVGALTASQMVAVVTVAAGLVTSSFGFGYWLGGTLESTAHAATKLALTLVEDERDRSAGEVTNLQAEIGRITEVQSFLQTKEVFLGFMVLWHDARQRVDAGDADPELSRRYDELSGNLFDFVMDLVQRSASGEAKAQVRARLGKGIQPTITFEQDNSNFPLPYELFATAE